MKFYSTALITFLFLSACQNKNEIIELPVRNGIPEGIAVDEMGNIYLSNLHTRDIVKCVKEGFCQIIETPYTGRLEGLGMVVDNGKLYALGNDDGYSSTLSVLQIIDVETLKLEKAYEWNDTIPTFFNDLVIHRSKPYITNTLQHSIFVLQGDSLAPIVSSQEIRYPNGITSSDNKNILFIASAKGIRTFDLDSYSFINEADTTTRGIDGLKFVDDRLIAVKNGAADKDDHCILFLDVENNGSKITLESEQFKNHPFANIPTTLAKSRKYVYALLNSQMDQLESNEIQSPEQLTNTYVLRFRPD